MHNSNHKDDFHSYLHIQKSVCFLLIPSLFEGDLHERFHTHAAQNGPRNDHQSNQAHLRVSYSADLRIHNAQVIKWILRRITYSLA